MKDRHRVRVLAQSSWGWCITGATVLAATGLWLSTQAMSDIFTNDLSLLLLDIGRFTGVIGITLYALSLIYDTRLRLLERMFGGLNKVYTAHHIIGGLALILLCIHPLFLSLQYVNTSLHDAGFILIPHALTPVGALFDSQSTSHQDVLQQWAIFGGIIAFWGMVLLLVLTFFIKLPYKLWLFTHKFLGLAFFIAGLHVLFISSDTSSSAPLKYYLLLLVGLGLLAYVYRTVLPDVFVRRYIYRVSTVTAQNADSVKVSLLPVRQSMTYHAGQFVYIQFLHAQAAGISTEWHPFSISSTPDDGPLEITAKALGDYTKKLSAIAPGTIARIEGAYGKFAYYNMRNLNQIWIAGGIGVTPFLSMLKSLPTSGYTIDFYYSVKNVSEVIEWQRIVQAAVLHGNNLRVIPFDSSRWHKRLDVAFILEFSESLEGKEILLCGPPAMMKSLTNQLRQAGAPKRAIHTEEFTME